MFRWFPHAEQERADGVLGAGHGVTQGVVCVAWLTVESRELLAEG